METNPTRNHEVVSSIPGPAQWVKGSRVAVSCGVGCRGGSDPTLLWLWRRLAATALIRPPTWEPPYAVGAALKGQKPEEKKKKSLPVISGAGVWTVLDHGSWMDGGSPEGEHEASLGQLGPRGETGGAGGRIRPNG